MAPAATRRLIAEFARSGPGSTSSHQRVPSPSPSLPRSAESRPRIASPRVVVTSWNQTWCEVQSIDANWSRQRRTN